MNPRDFLRASLLDIIFEHRNKDYGAYALRKEYNHRMIIAVLSGMSLVFIFIIVSLFNTGRNYSDRSVISDDRVIIKTVEFEPEKIKQPELPPQRQTATIHDATIRVVPDNIADTDVPTEDETEGRQTSIVTTEGSEFTNTNTIQPAATTVQPETTTRITETDLTQRDAEFPGGQAALQKFLSENLVTPDDLEGGELKRVEVRFTVDKEGRVSGFVIINSGGREFDQEVIRVCRRMPKWLPAMQNGIHVPVNYILPVTFVGLEQ
jgi:periplasmic protein TonB